MTIVKFPENFLWGAASSGPQTEGIEKKANLNVWDSWYQENPTRFYKQLSAEVACDTFNRYKNDVKLMTDVGMNSFRTSIQWSRLMKDVEQGIVDPVAVEFYNNYINEMLDAGIEPVINLYHFDMPAILYQKYGGFESKCVIDLYAHFAKTCFELFGDRVKYFTTFNEPIVPVEAGYIYCNHFPGKYDPKLGIQVGFNTLVAQAKAIQEYRKLDLNGKIGTTLNLTPAYPRSDHPADLKASEICDTIHNKSMVEPSVYGTFPKLLIELFQESDVMPEFDQHELDLIANNTVDFLGLNYYVPRRVSAPAKQYNKDTAWTPNIYYDDYKLPGGRINPHRANNEIYPKALYDIAKLVQNEYSNIEWYVAEIGISLTGEENLKDENGVVDDHYRTELFKEHMYWLSKAIEEGSNCFGVHQWTFIDNWSWCNSHMRRYGFYYLDLDTRERTMKRHGYWFKQFVKENQFEF